jgi:hypothetical protein
MKIVCFVIAYLTVRLGYELIASGVKGEFRFTGSMAGTKAELASVSPGLLFVFLGVVLAIYAMSVEKSVDIGIHPAHADQATDPPPLPIPGPLTPERKEGGHR